MVTPHGPEDAELDRIFRALAHRVRRDILRRTLAHEQSISALADEYDMSLASVQKHIAMLETANLVIKRTVGRQRLVSTNSNRLVDLPNWSVRIRHTRAPSDIA